MKRQRRPRLSDCAPWIYAVLVACAALAVHAAEQRTPTDRQLLNRFPEADANKDGRLDQAERDALRQKLQGGARRASNQDPISAKGVRATHTGVRYGPHERNVLDLWLAKSDTPTPLVIFIHGGGFTSGDKSKAYGSKEIDEFLEAGVSFASLSYRYRTNEPTGVRASLSDSKRALQFLRSKAGEWNLDKTRVGAYGGSAGAGTSLWLATHDDMAEPNNPDPVLRESTRLSVGGCNSTQATYDLLRWPEFLQTDTEDAMKQEVTAFYGVKTMADLETAEGKAIRADLDMLALLSKGDAPLYVSNPLPGGLPPTDRGHLLHHPAHAAAVKKRADEVGVEALVYAKGAGVEPPEGRRESMVQFFLRHLRADP
jgi:acetyl esterase/lipase